MKKRIKSKPVKSRRSSASLPVDQDIVGLLSTLVNKLTSFEGKLDMVLSRLSSQPALAPRQQTTLAYPPERHRESRPMHRATCADCGRDCQVPFKPSGGRPVYCKECFGTRKNNSAFKPRRDEGPRERPPVYARSSETPEAFKSVRTLKKKKPAAKNKNKKNKKK